ncbi:MAG: hypothetical protein VX223_01025 [Myxococcota bacterium]|nr:hypothetical protein [Myxococcota bacterium]
MTTSSPTAKVSPGAGLVIVMVGAAGSAGTSGAAVSVPGLVSPAPRSEGAATSVGGTLSSAGSEQAVRARSRLVAASKDCRPRMGASGKQQVVLER